MRAYKFAADTQIKITKCTIRGFALSSGGDNDASLVLYDEADNSMTDGKQTALTRIQDGDSKNVNFSKPLFHKNGCYANITGTNAWAIVYID